jgi:hypothetical protein
MTPSPSFRPAEARVERTWSRVDFSIRKDLFHRGDTEYAEILPGGEERGFPESFAFSSSKNLCALRVSAVISTHPFQLFTSFVFLIKKFVKFVHSSHSY